MTANRTPFAAAPYMVKVELALLARGADFKNFSRRELHLISLGEHYAVGPDDCAVQIISDREERAA